MIGIYVSDDVIRCIDISSLRENALIVLHSFQERVAWVYFTHCSKTSLGDLKLTQESILANPVNGNGRRQVVSLFFHSWTSPLH